MNDAAEQAYLTACGKGHGQCPHNPTPKRQLLLFGALEKLPGKDIPRPSVPHFPARRLLLNRGQTSPLHLVPTKQVQPPSPSCLASPCINASRHASYAMAFPIGLYITLRARLTPLFQQTTTRSLPARLGPFQGGSSINHRLRTECEVSRVCHPLAFLPENESQIKPVQDLCLPDSPDLSASPSPELGERGVRGDTHGGGGTEAPQLGTARGPPIVKARLVSVGLVAVFGGLAPVGQVQSKKKLGGFRTAIVCRGEAWDSFSSSTSESGKCVRPNHGLVAELVGAAPAHGPLHKASCWSLCRPSPLPSTPTSRDSTLAWYVT